MDRDTQQLVEATALALCVLAVATARCTDPALLANVIRGMGARTLQLKKNSVLASFVEKMVSAVEELGPPAPEKFS
jgi:hypothetical protein